MHRPVLDVEAFFVAGARDSAHCQKWAKCEGFVVASRTLAAWDIWRGSDRLCKDAFRMADAAQETHESDMFGADFLEWLYFAESNLEVCLDDFAWQARHSLPLGITFSWQVHYFKHMEWQNRKNTLVRGCTQLSIVEGGLAELLGFWCCQLHKVGKSRWTASFWMLSTSKSEEVWQNCFVFNVVKFKNWGRLAAWLRFLMVSSSTLEDVLQNSFVFKLADTETDRSTERWIDKQTDR